MSSRRGVHPRSLPPSPLLAAVILAGVAILGGPAAAQIPNIDFQLVWDSGGILNDVATVEAGDADRDGLFDFVGARASPSIVHLFESDLQGGYTEVWNSASTSSPGGYVDFVFADTDSDSLGEIFGAIGAGEVMLFEQSGSGGFDFVHDLIQEADPGGNRRVRAILAGDTDLDTQAELIVLAGGSNPPDGLVAIWEHSGLVGENAYARVFSYTTNAFIASGAIGDSDNDGLPEILLGFEGFAGFPLNIHRLEYDPNQATWVHSQFTSAVIGLPRAPHAADLDQDGLVELAYGSDGEVLVFENVGENMYELRYATAEPLSGKVLSLTSRLLTVPGTPTFAAGSAGADLATWSYDPNRSTFDQTYTQSAVGGPLTGLALDDDGNDGFEELVVAVGGVDEVRVYRRFINLAAGPGAPVAPRQALLSAAPNPVTTLTRLTAPASVRAVVVHDASGRTVRRLHLIGGSGWWDTRDEAGRAVPRGVYWLRVEGEAETGPGGRAARVAGLPIAVTR